MTATHSPGVAAATTHTHDLNHVCINMHSDMVSFATCTVQPTYTRWMGKTNASITPAKIKNHGATTTTVIYPAVTIVTVMMALRRKRSSSIST